MSNNNNNTRWLTVVTLLLLVANIVTLALLWTKKEPVREYFTPPPQQHTPGGQVFEFITRELQLDAAQRENYKKLRDEHQLQVRPLQERIGKAKDSFFDLLKQEQVADSLVETFSKNIGALEQQRDVITFRHFQKVRLICTKEQKVKFDSIIQQALHQMGRPRGPMPQFNKSGQPLPKPGMKPGGQKLPPPPDGEMMPAAGPPHPPPGWRPEDGPPPHPPGMRPGEGPPPGGMRPPPKGMRPPPHGTPPPKDSIH